MSRIRSLLCGALLAAFILSGFVGPPRTVSARSAAIPFTSHCTGFTPHATYNVGTGQTYTSIGAVPFESLVAGDIVRIHYRATPYFEKIAISTSGTSAKPICLIGVPGPNGELPIIDGQNATTSAHMFYDYDGMQQRGLLTIMGQDWGELPNYINIEGLHFRNAYPDYTFTTASGQVRNYTSNAAAVHIQRGEHIRITGSIISDSANGLFAATTGEVEQVTRDLTLEYSYVYNNGTNGDQHHNTYTESIGMIYQFNRFGPPRSISGGNNIKDRSSGLIVRYNWIEGGAHLIDMVEGEDGWDLLSQQADYNQAFVYGNIMLNTTSAGRNTMHFGGDLGGEDNEASSVCGFGSGQDPTECYRKGPLYFYNNTVIFYENSGGYKTLFRLQTDEQTVNAFNNIIHVVGTGGELSYMNRRGTATFGKNLLNRGSSVLHNFYSQEGVSSIIGLANIQVLTSAAATGFADATNKNFHLLPSSPAVNQGQALPGAALPVTSEYVTHQGSTVRVVSGAIDYGAFELAGPAGATIGVYKNGIWYLRNTNSAGATDLQVNFGGDVSDLPVVGDWNGDGRDTIGIMRTSTGIFFLSDSNTTPASTYSLVFGNPGDTPFAGHWSSDMTHDGLGVYRPSNGILYQKKQLTTGFSDFFAIFGNPGDSGVGGDWNGDGIDSIGVYRPSVQTWFLTNNGQPNGITFSDINFVWNIGTGTAVVGDWDGDGITTVGFFTAAGLWTQHPTNTTAGTDVSFTFGPTDGKPVAGKWNGSSTPALASLSVNNLIVPSGNSNPSGATNFSDSSGD